MTRRKGVRRLQDELEFLSEDEVGYMSPVGLAMLDNPRYEVSAFHDFLDENLRAVERGQIDRLVVNVPPQHGKSTLASHYFSAWYLGLHPERKVILGAYGDTLAQKFGRDVRDTLTRHGPSVFGKASTVRGDVASMKEWELEGGGGMLSVGIGSGSTGRGAHLFIVDDPVKDAREARSVAVQENNFDWLRSVAMTRLAPGGAMVMVQTRWNEKDLTGLYLKAAKEAGEEVVVINLPALAEEDDPLGREPGEALYPERYNRDELLRKKAGMGSYLWNALYQQRPAPDSGSFFKRETFQYFEIEEHANGAAYFVLHRVKDAAAGLIEDKRVPVIACSMFQTVDTAATEKESSDFFVISTWVQTPDRDLLLIDVVREKAETTKHNRLILGAWSKWRPFNLRVVGVESKNAGLNIIQGLRGQIAIKPLKAELDKLARATSMQALYETGKVYHLSGAPWLGDFEDEMVKFPNGSHDDQVDTAAYAAIMLTAQGKREVNVF